jgi:hypothetical protein
MFNDRAFFAADISQNCGSRRRAQVIRPSVRISNANWHRNANAWQRPMVTVAADEKQADAVTGILRQFDPSI